jgi:hypothetical protein
MVSRNRKIARRIGQAVANDVLDISGAISTGAGVTVYATADDLPTTGLTAGDEAFVSGSNRLYISNGAGWYSIGLVNTNPAITSVEDPSSNTTPFTLATDGSALVLTITAADPEGIPLTYNYAVTTGSLTNGGGTTATVVQGTGASTNQFTITPTSTEAYAGTFELTFTATDGINTATSGANSFTLSFSIDWTTVTEEASLNTSGAGSQFGLNVGIDESGSSIVASSHETPKGAAYVFTRSGTTWSQDAKLVPNNFSSSSGDVGSGNSVCISKDGTYVVLGGIYDDTNVSYGGGAHVFVYASGSWSEQARLDASDAGSLFMPRFGSSVAIDGDNDTIAVGAANSTAVYVFTRSGTTWSEEQKITPTYAVGAPDMFGGSVSLSEDGNTLAVGAYQATYPNVSQGGEVYIFTRSGTTWSQEATIKPSDVAADDHFGWKSLSVSADGNTLLAASRRHDSNSLSDNGAAYIFTRSGTTWTQEAKLVPSDAHGNQWFGTGGSINANGDIVIVGAERSDISGDNYAGAAYIFQKSNSSWSQSNKLTASNSSSSDYFGQQVGISKDGNYAVSGAWGAPSGGYVYTYKAG